MHNSSASLESAICAIQGESDLNIVGRALDNERWAHIIASAPNAHPIIRAIAALAGGLPDLLPDSIVSDPALHDALAQMIGTPEGRRILYHWAKIAPAQWGRAHVAALRTAVDNDRCDAGVAAALIGPCADSADLIRSPDDIASAVHCWGRSNPRDPTAWVRTIPPDEQARLFSTLQRDPHAIARCLPWLPPDKANLTNIDKEVLAIALNAYADASSIARAQHADLLRSLVAQTKPSHLNALTRLACATQAKDVWLRVQLLTQKPHDAEIVVSTAPWDDLPEDVRSTVADLHPAISVARGRPRSGDAMHRDNRAFFAALNARVWDSLDPAAQRQWLQKMTGTTASLAIRSLGLRPELLERASIDNALVRIIKRHTRDTEEIRAALFPVAIGAAPIDAAYTLITSLPALPPDLGTFFCIAGKRGDPDIIMLADAVIRTNTDLALAVTLQRLAASCTTISGLCKKLQETLRGRTWDAVVPIMPILSDDARTAIMPKTREMAHRLAHPNQQAAMCRALAQLGVLPLEIAIPTYIALNQWKQQWQAWDAGNAIANVLRNHGDVYLAIADALVDNRRSFLLPFSSDPRQNAILRDLARDEPPTAQRLAHAIQTRDARAALYALLTAPPHHANTVWQSLVEHDVFPLGVASLTGKYEQECDIIADLALLAIRSDDTHVRDAGIIALASRPAFFQQVRNRLPDDVLQDVRRLIESRSGVHQTKNRCQTR